MEMKWPRASFFLLVLLIISCLTAEPGSRLEIGEIAPRGAPALLYPSILASSYAGLGSGWGSRLAKAWHDYDRSRIVVALTLPAFRHYEFEMPAGSLATFSSGSGKKGDIFIYCTHTTESYLPEEGVSRTEGRPGLILEVAEAMGKELQREGYRVTVCETMHDWPDFTVSYSRSRSSVASFLSSHERVRAVIDVHRDALPEGKISAVEINGEKAAPLLLIVGSDQRQPHPLWHENLAFAERIYEQSKSDYPALIRGVRVKAGVYNQDLCTHGILVEVGTDHSSFSEARWSARLFARVLGRVLDGEALSPDISQP